MSLFRSTTFLASRSFVARPFVSRAAAASFSTRVPLRAQQDYGSGAGSPEGENPQSQGTSEASANLEHPGPPPPKAGQGSGSTPTKGGSTQSNAASSSNKSSEGGEKSSGSSTKGTQTQQSTPTEKTPNPKGAKGEEARSAGTKGAKPKILDHDAPAEGEASEDVQKHNREMDQRAEKAHEKVSDEDHEKNKVGKNFWSGHGGADRDP